MSEIHNVGPLEYYAAQFADTSIGEALFSILSEYPDAGVFAIGAVMVSMPVMIAAVFLPVIVGINLQSLIWLGYKDIESRIRRSCRGQGPGLRDGNLRPDLTDALRKAPIRGVEVVTKAAYSAHGQAFPPNKRVANIFSAGDLPKGELLDYPPPKARRRFGRPVEDMKLEEDDEWERKVRSLREGAEILRQVRQYVQQTLRPGLEVSDIIDTAEKSLWTLVGGDSSPLKRNLALPVGLALNEVVQNFTTNPGDGRRFLHPTDLASLDLAVRVEDQVVESAFSFSFDPMHDELLQAVRNATEEGVRLIGPDAVVADIGVRMREVLESLEVHQPPGALGRGPTVLPVRAMSNVTGDMFQECRLGFPRNTIPLMNYGGEERRIRKGELWVVDVYGSVGGTGYAIPSSSSASHYARATEDVAAQSSLDDCGEGPRSLLKLIDKQFPYQAFCPRWLMKEAEKAKLDVPKTQTWWQEPLAQLAHRYFIEEAKPLCDLPGSVVAHYGHTVLLGDTGKEVLTRGADF